MGKVFVAQSLPSVRVPELRQAPRHKRRLVLRQRPRHVLLRRLHVRAPEPGFYFAPHSISHDNIAGGGCVRLLAAIWRVGVCMSAEVEHEL